MVKKGCKDILFASTIPGRRVVNPAKRKKEKGEKETGAIHTSYRHAWQMVQTEEC